MTNPEERAYNARNEDAGTNIEGLLKMRGIVNLPKHDLITYLVPMIIFT